MTRVKICFNVTKSNLDRGLISYLGELVEAEDLFTVVVAMATLVHQSVELDSNLVFKEGEHHK